MISTLIVLSLITSAVLAWCPHYPVYQRDPYRPNCPCYRNSPYDCGCPDPCEKKKDKDKDDDKPPAAPRATCNPCNLPPPTVPMHNMKNEVTPKCPITAESCTFFWNLTQLVAMVIYDNQTGVGTPVIEKDGCFFKITGNNTLTPATLNDLAQVITVDGNHRFVMAVNGMVPGPTIMIYENQTANIVVYNNMMSEGTGIHWHGMFQISTPWMDGVTSVSQCPINIEETFIYSFKAAPRGSQWYHSHTGLQRTNGMFGAFVVFPLVNRTDIPSFDKDYLAVFLEWHHLETNLDYFSSFWNFKQYIKDNYNSTASNYPVATLVNGRGLFDARTISPCWGTTTIYKVRSGLYYRFRFMNTGKETPYIMEIQRHRMTVIASDGSPLTPFNVDQLVAHIGERYDVYIRANQSVNNYWITFTSLNNPQQVGYAILQYQGANTSALPIFQPKVCTTTQKCVVANCPAQNFTGAPTTHTCINIGNMTSTGQYDYFDVDHEDDDVEDHFLVFSITKSPQGGNRPSINARHFQVPSKPPQVFRQVDFDRPCWAFDCDNEPCSCTNMFNVTKGKTIQVVFAAGIGTHPVHMHGHDYQVVKVVYGTPGKVNPDINCRSSDPTRCVNPTWTNPSWLGGNVPGLNTVNPPAKDTTIVPSGGYVVVRFKADNPGWWMLHCHIEPHLEDGMGIIMQEGEPSDMTPPPTGFSTCGSFRGSQ